MPGLQSYAVPLDGRGYKSNYSDQTLCGEKVWFAAHRGLMYFVVSLTAAGFVLIM